MLRGLIAGILLCVGPEATAQTAVQPPTANEIFHLRTECAKLGEELLPKHPWIAAKQQSAFSHYDPMSNRCYVEVRTTLPSGFVRSLYDGHTGEGLAEAVSPNNGTTGYGSVIGRKEQLSFETAAAFISGKMAGDRKQ